MMSLSLLWAIMLYSQQAVAYAAAPVTLPAASAAVQTTSSSAEIEELWLQQGIQHYAQEATPSVVSVNLQQAATPARYHTFRFPTDEAIPPYAARAPGLNFLSKFFPTSIQPHAP